MKKFTYLLISLILLGGCTKQEMLSLGGLVIPVEWKKAGFDNKENKGNKWQDWDNVGFGSRDAGWWKKQGVDLENATIAQQNGLTPKYVDKHRGYPIIDFIGIYDYAKTFKYFSLDDILNWSAISARFRPHRDNSRFNLRNAYVMKENDIPPLEAHVWFTNHFNLQETIQWKRAGFTPNQAKIITKQGLSVIDVQPWKGSGYTVVEIKHCIDNNFTRENAQYWDKKVFGVCPTGWRTTGLTPKAALAYVQAGYDAQQTIQLRQAELSLSHAKTWRTNGYSYYTMLELHKLGISGPEKVKKWSAVNEKNHIVQWYKAGVKNPTTAKAWRDIGMKPEDAKKAIDKGFNTPQKASREIRRQHQALVASNRPLLVGEEYDCGTLNLLFLHPKFYISVGETTLLVNIELSGEQQYYQTGKYKNYTLYSGVYDNKRSTIKVLTREAARGQTYNIIHDLGFGGKVQCKLHSQK